MAYPKTKNFNISEFNSKDGTPVPLKYYVNLHILMENLEVIRAYFGGAPITISSGYRSQTHNDNVGGSPNSQHLLAKAGDLKVKGFTPTQVFQGIVFLMDSGKIKKGGIGLYPTFVHYDIRGNKVTWNG